MRNAERQEKMRTTVITPHNKDGAVDATGVWITGDDLSSMGVYSERNRIVIGTHKKVTGGKAHDRAIAFTEDGKITLQFMDERNQIRFIDLEPGPVKQALANLLNDLLGQNLEKLLQAKPNQL